MSRVCSVCSRPNAGLINQFLLEGRSARSLAAEFELSADAVERHRNRHLPAGALGGFVSSRRARSTGDPLAELISSLRARALSGSDAAAREYRLALAAQSDAKHAAPPSRDLETEPEWIRVRSTLLEALWPFPEARVAAAAALLSMGLEGDPDE
jgi:hypothetical protein